MARFWIIATSLAAALCASATLAAADEAPAQAGEQASLEGFAAAAPFCLEWSDGCAVCARDDNNVAHCSTPGVACQPTAIACRREKAK
jgi:hypothetical protein